LIHVGFILVQELRSRLPSHSIRILIFRHSDIPAGQYQLWILSNLSSFPVYQLSKQRTACRFYFMKEIVFGQDGDFNEERFRFTVNANLANDIGNLTNRCLNLLKKNCDSQYPVAASDVPDDHALRVLATKATADSAAAYDELAMHDAISSALSISGRYVADVYHALLSLTLRTCKSGIHALNACQTHTCCNACDSAFNTPQHVTCIPCTSRISCNSVYRAFMCTLPLSIHVSGA
jgi:hypothetical protein